MSVRQQIIDALVTQLRTITVANGYNLTISDRVYDWKVNPLLPANLPAIEIRDKESTIELTALDGSTMHQLNVDVVVFATGAAAAATVRKGLEDIAKALHVDRTFGGLVQVFKPESSALDMQQEEHLLAAGQYAINITYYTGPGEI